MRDDQYLEVLHKNMDAVKNGEAKEELMPLLQWLKHWRPAQDGEAMVEYLTSAEIQSTMSELMNIDLNLISTTMWRLGYEVSVAATHPAWAMIMTD